MKTHWLKIIITLLATGLTNTVFAVDFAQTNPVLREILSTVIQNDDLIWDANPNFDEIFSDLEAERLKYDLTAYLKNTPWSPEDLAKAETSSRYVVDRNPFHRGIKVEVDFSISTDTLAMLRHAGVVALKNMKDGSEVQKATIRLLQQLTQAKTLDEVHVILLEGQKVASDQANKELNENISELKKVQATKNENYGFQSREDLLAGLNRIIEDKRHLITTIKSTQIAINLLSEIEVSNLSAEKFFEKWPETFKSGQVDLKITSKSIHAKVNTFVTVGVKALNDLKVHFKQTLTGVQNGLDAEKDQVREIYRNALVAIKRVIRNGNAHEPAEQG